MHKPSAIATLVGRLWVRRKLQLMAARQLRELRQRARISPAQPAAPALQQAMLLATEAALLMCPSLHS